MSVRGEIEGDVLASMQEFVMADGARLDDGCRVCRRFVEEKTVKTVKVVKAAWRLTAAWSSPKRPVS